MSPCVRKWKSALLLLVATISLLSGSAASAQTFRGTILGTVTDSTGAAITGAAVAIKNVDTGLARTVSTSEDGTYSVPELPIGTYSRHRRKNRFQAGRGHRQSKSKYPENRAPT